MIKTISKYVNKFGLILSVVIIFLWCIKPIRTWLTGLSWVDESFIFAVVAICLTLVLLSIDSVKDKLDNLNSGSNLIVHISSKQSESNTNIIEYLSNKHRIGNANLLELSSVTVTPILKSLVDKKARIRLLIQNPIETINDWQRSRVITQLRSLHSTTFRHYDNFEIRAYRKPASVRGRLIDEKCLSIGWYAYSIETEENPVGVHGHDNPVLEVYRKSDFSTELFKFFRTIFNDLWDHPNTLVVNLNNLDSLLQKNTFDSEEMT